MSLERYKQNIQEKVKIHKQTVEILKNQLSEYERKHKYIYDVEEILNNTCHDFALLDNDSFLCANAAIKIHENELETGAFHMPILINEYYDITNPDEIIILSEHSSIVILDYLYEITDLEEFENNNNMYFTSLNNENIYIIHITIHFTLLE